MSARTITIHAFCSAKGGVGKSTLAVACAKLLAGDGPSCVLIDADMTGTSLADGLALCAPKVPLREDGSLDLDAAPTGAYYTVAETRRLRFRRGDSERREHPPPPVYFNDPLVYTNEDEDQDCRIDALFWKHAQDDKVRYLPSSPLRVDVERALGWLFSEEYELAWQHRTAWLLYEMSLRMPALTDVVVDLPPGLFGFAHAVLRMMSRLSQGRPLLEGVSGRGEQTALWKVKPSLVTSQDENDLLSALEYFAASYLELPELTPIVNRVTLPAEHLRARARDLFEGRVGALGMEQKLEFLEALPSTLGRIFQPGTKDLPLDALGQADMKALRKALRLEGDA